LKTSSLLLTAGITDKSDIQISISVSHQSLLLSIDYKSVKSKQTVTWSPMVTNCQSVSFSITFISSPYTTNTNNHLNIQYTNELEVILILSTIITDQRWTWSLGSQLAAECWLFANIVADCHYFPPGLQLPSKLQGMLLAVPNYNNLLRVITWQWKGR